MSKFSNIKANRINSQTHGSNFFQGLNADITNANITNANITNGNITNGNITNADIINANITNINVDTINITSTTQSTDPTNGAVVVAGGVGVGKNLNIGGNETIRGTLGVTGAVSFLNDLGVGGNVGITGNLGVGGNIGLTGYINKYYINTQPINSLAITNNNLIQLPNNSVGLGYNSLLKYRYGTNNTGVGFFALCGSTSSIIGGATGSYNTAVGSLSLRDNVKGVNNCAFGSSALNLSNSDNNSAFGANALFNNTGNVNNAFGSSSLNLNSTGIDNCAFGFQSLYSNTTGSQNTAMGNDALYANGTGTGSVAIGHLAGRNLQGSNNVFIGSFAGYGASGQSNNIVCVGFNAQPSAPGVTGEFTLGNSSIGALRCQQTSITTLSDQRDKADITDLDLGIDFINKVKPSKFKWDLREWYENNQIDENKNNIKINNQKDGSKKSSEWTAGFIAQQLDSVQTETNSQYLKLVWKSNPDKLEATPGNLFPVIIKALQDLSKQNAELKIRVEQLEKIINP